MKNALLCLLLGLLFCELLSGQIPSYTYRDDEAASRVFEVDELWIVDSLGTMSLDQIMADTSLKAYPFDELPPPEPPYYLWSAIELKNASSIRQDNFLGGQHMLDSIWGYSVSEGRMLEAFLTGKEINSWDKPFVNIRNMIPINLSSGSSRTYYFRQLIAPETAHAIDFKMLYLKPGSATRKAIHITYVWQFFYLGLTCLFGLLSIFMYWIFKEKVFLYFGLLMISFGGYFLAINKITDTFINWPFFDGQNFLLLNTMISGIVFSFSLFSKHYLELDKHFPHYIHIYGYYIVIMELIAHIGYIWLGINSASDLHNQLLLVWIIGAFVPIVMLAWRGSRAARMLLATLVLLVVFAAVFLVQLLEKTNNFLMLNSFQIGTILFGTIIFYDLFTKINTIRKEKEHFQALDSLKSRFFANISHEFRTPLTLIAGPLQEIAPKLSQPADRKLVSLMQRNTDRLLRLINQLLDLSKIEAGKLSVQAEEINVVTFLKGIIMSFESLAQRKGINLKFDSQQIDIRLWVDPKKMEDVFNNLLSNALKFTAEAGRVHITLVEQADTVTITIRDNGRGIASAKLPYVFNRFFQADNQHADDAQGSGIGMALARELVGLHQGTIVVESVEKEYTAFTLNFQRGKVHFAAEDLAEKTSPAAETNSTTAVPAEAILPSLTTLPDEQLDDRKLHDAPLVLLVEDNEDVRYYVRQHLQRSFRIVEAEDGQDGIDKALAYLPDLIISDVMMPQKNGYELCQTLKTDPRTSHIPLILLTAKASQEEKRHGLIEGADDYLIKPFDTQELQIRVNNLIALRKQLRVQFAVGEEPQVIEPSLNAVDKAFMEQLFATLTRELANEQLNVDLLAADLAMSPRHLNRKLSVLTGLSANRFIRNYRLQEAMRMLQRKEGNVSDVATATGFNSTAYFVKCFGDKFDQTPGSVLEL